MKVRQFIGDLAAVARVVLDDWLEQKRAAARYSAQENTELTSMTIERDYLLDRVGQLEGDCDDLARKLDAADDRIDELRFNGPTLFQDEVEAIRTAIEAQTDRNSHGHLTFAMKDSLRRVLRRSDALPTTEEELTKVSKEAADDDIPF